jgi:hypothetical protein
VQIPIRYKQHMTRISCTEPLPEAEACRAAVQYRTRVVAGLPGQPVCHVHVCAHA